MSLIPIYCTVDERVWSNQSFPSFLMTLWLIPNIWGCSWFKWLNEGWLIGCYSVISFLYIKGKLFKSTKPVLISINRTISLSLVMHTYLPSTGYSSLSHKVKHTLRCHLLLSLIWGHVTCTASTIINRACHFWMPEEIGHDFQKISIRTY